MREGKEEFGQNMLVWFAFNASKKGFYLVYNRPHTDKGQRYFKG